jgi:putative transposase
VHPARYTLTREDAVRLIQTYVDHYNAVRLHSAIGYVTPHDMLAGRQAEIHAARKLEEARHQRQLGREAAEAASLLAHSSNTTTMTSPGETEAGSAGMQPC